MIFVTVYGILSGVAAISHADSLPNMIFVMTDDQGWGDVGYNGHPKIRTPNRDAMAEAGKDKQFCASQEFTHCHITVTP